MPSFGTLRHRVWSSGLYQCCSYTNMWPLLLLSDISQLSHASNRLAPKRCHPVLSPSTPFMFSPDFSPLSLKFFSVCFQTYLRLFFPMSSCQRKNILFKIFSICVMPTAQVFSFPFDSRQFFFYSLRAPRYPPPPPISTSILVLYASANQYQSHM